MQVYMTFPWHLSLLAWFSKKILSLFRIALHLKPTFLMSFAYRCAQSTSNPFCAARISQNFPRWKILRSKSLRPFLAERKTPPRQSRNGVLSNYILCLTLQENESESKAARVNELCIPLQLLQDDFQHNADASTFQCQSFYCYN